MNGKMPLGGEFCNYYCQKFVIIFVFFFSKLTNLINFKVSEWRLWALSGWRPSLMEFSNFECLFWRIFCDFLEHLFKIHMIPSPVKQKQTKTTHQQIQSHLKKANVSGFLVISNEALQRALLWINIVKIRPAPENSEWANVFRSWC